MISEEQIAGLIIFSVSLIRFLTNWTVAILIRKLASLKNSFGTLTASQSIGDAIHCTLFAFLFSPMCIFNIDFLKNHSSYIGHALLVCYDISTYSHLFISLNRICSISAPMHYLTIFSAQNTRIFVFLSWTFAIFPSFVLYIYHDCKLIYYDYFWAFLFSTTPVCQNIVWYADFLKYNSLVSLIVIIDLITVCRVRSFRANLAVISVQSKEKKRAEINFLKQACLQAFVFVCELITYFIITPKLDPKNRWLCFSFTSLAWVLVHTLDGIITLTFNSEFSQVIAQAFRKRNQSSLEMRSKAHGNSATAVTAF